jgi:hypothetical protein
MKDDALIAAPADERLVSASHAPTSKSETGKQIPPQSYNRYSYPICSPSDKPQFQHCPNIMPTDK